MFDDDLLEQFRAAMPPAFPLVEIDRLTGGLVHSRTLHNMRSNGSFPAECFFRSGRKVAVRRDEFLKHWSKRWRA